MRFIFTLIFAASLTSCTASNRGDVAHINSKLNQKAWAETCETWDDWDKSGPGFRIHHNTYYVGTCGISAVLITGSEGHVLIDGGTEKGPDIIARNINQMGFDVTDIRILLHSHEHFDHVAGLAELQRISGAALYSSVAARPVFLTGEAAKSDPQHGMHAPFPPALVARTVDNNETVHLGDISLTALASPGHTEGALSWQWKSCHGDHCEWIVYADSLSPVSGDRYRFSDHLEYLNAYSRGLTHLREIDCTLLITPHPSASGMRKRLEAEQLSDVNACASYSDAVRARLDKRLQKETIEK